MTSSSVHVGTHAITATYNGSTDFNPASGNDIHRVIPHSETA